MTDKEAIKYLQQLYPNGGHCWLDEQRIEAISMAVKALQEEPVSEDLEEAASRYAKEEYNRKSPATLPDRCRGCYAPLMYAFKAGTKWKEEQLEKNRLAHCDTQTDEEAEIERDFVMGIIENEHRQPTFDDAIKYGMRLQRENMMKGAVNGLVYAQRTNGEVMFRSNYVKKEGFEFGDKVKVIVIKED